VGSDRERRGRGRRPEAGADPNRWFQPNPVPGRGVEGTRVRVSSMDAAALPDSLAGSVAAYRPSRRDDSDCDDRCLLCHPICAIAYADSHGRCRRVPVQGISGVSDVQAPATLWRVRAEPVVSPVCASPAAEPAAECETTDRDALGPDLRRARMRGEALDLQHRRPLRPLRAGAQTRTHLGFTDIRHCP
jgi:hypothetical protein